MTTRGQEQKDREVMKKPERIYLQWYGEDYGPKDGEPPLGSEITWCQDRIGNSDLEYVLVTAVEGEVSAEEMAKTYLEHKWVADSNDGHGSHQLVRSEKDVAELITLHTARVAAKLRAENEELRKVLSDCQDVFNEMDGISWEDESEWQHSSYEDTRDRVNAALEPPTPPQPEQDGKTSLDKGDVKS